MSITNPRDNKGKKKNPKNTPGHQGSSSKFIPKPGKAQGTIKPHKPGGTRGS